MTVFTYEHLYLFWLTFFVFRLFLNHRARRILMSVRFLYIVNCNENKVRQKN